MDRHSAQQRQAPAAATGTFSSSTAPRYHAYRAFEASLDQHFVLDLSGRLLYANRAVLAQWGQTLDQVVGRSLEDLGYGPGVIEELHEALLALSTDRQSLIVPRPF